MIPKLVAQAITITYTNQQNHRSIAALEGVDFTVHDGQFLVNVIAGMSTPNQTLLKCACSFGANDRHKTTQHKSKDDTSEEQLT